MRRSQITRLRLDAVQWLWEMRSLRKLESPTLRPELNKVSTGVDDEEHFGSGQIEHSPGSFSVASTDLLEGEGQAKAILGFDSEMFGLPNIGLTYYLLPQLQSEQPFQYSLRSFELSHFSVQIKFEAPETHRAGAVTSVTERQEIVHHVSCDPDVFGVRVPGRNKGRV